MIVDTRYFIEKRKYKVWIGETIVDTVYIVDIERNVNDINYIWVNGNLIEGVHKVNIDENGFEYICYDGLCVKSSDLIMYNDESIIFVHDSEDIRGQWFGTKR